MTVARPRRSRVAANRVASRGDKRTPLRMVNWVVKVSKLCNLRCRYCYEWNELHRTERISLSEWERLLDAIRSYHERRRAEVGEPFTTTIIWHGGEPLLLPLPYLRSVFALQHQILGALLDTGAVVNAMQSNLYRISDEQIELLKAENVQLGVSCDVAGGVRLSLGGRETEDQVAQNMDRVRATGMDFGAITVLAAHTAPRITEIYDFYKSLGMAVRFLPLFAAPLNTPDASFGLTTAQAEDALQRLFVHWVKQKRRVPVLPVDDCVATVLRSRYGMPTWKYDRQLGEWAFIVNTDGTLYQTHEAYDPRWTLGNVFTQPIDDVLASPTYAASFARDRALVDRTCTGCRWKPGCSMLPAFDGTLAGERESRCNYAYALCEFIDEYFTSHDFSLDQIAGLLPEDGALTTVDIGSSIEFHGGIHASLLSDRPAGTRYRVAAPEHVFVRRERTRRSFRANRDLAVAEVIDPGPGRLLFHSARWPVVNRRSWVVDLDDFAYPVLWGRSAIDPRQRQRLTRGGSQFFLERSARMLAAYTHPSCKAILFLTEHGVADARQWLRSVATPEIARSFLSRCHVVPGAHRALDRAEVRRKWRDDPLSVVFCGRDYHQKNGRLALDVMTSLARQFPAARFHYLGEAPKDAPTRRFDALANATFHGPLPRTDALRIMAASHVLFHPARYESFGMVYAEAMAGGLAIVSSSGPQLPHVGEFLDKDGAVLVRCKGDDPARDRSMFERALARLMADRSAAAAMALANHHTATNGALSVRRRNALLQRIYSSAREAPGEPLRIEDLEVTGRGASIVRLTARELIDDFESFRRAVPRAPTSVLLNAPGL